MIYVVEQHKEIAEEYKKISEIYKELSTYNKMSANVELLNNDKQSRVHQSQEIKALKEVSEETSVIDYVNI